jgi:predicted TIM-barrel enzyme
MTRPTRSTLLAKFHEQVRNGIPLIGGGAGTGLSAKCEEAGGIDLIVIYNSGRYRMAGLGSLAGVLAYGNANEIVMDMAREVLNVVRHTPVLAGVNGTDPFCNFDLFLDQIAAVGFAGIQNFPTVGLIDGVFRQNLEETGMSYDREVDLVALACRKDLLTTPYVFDENQARTMTRAGADIVVAHMGLTTGGTIGATTAFGLDEARDRVERIAAAALETRGDVLVLCHGGPIATPGDAQYILDTCANCHGFYGASSMERLPVETAIVSQIRAFKDIRRHHSAPSAAGEAAWPVSISAT